jgi:hypothetical protein
VADDSYTNGPEGVETLVYDGQTYVRTVPEGEWETPGESGYDFDSLNDYFRNVGRKLDTVPAEFFDSATAERLPDEYIDGRHTLVISIRLDDFLDVFLQSLRQTLQELPTTPDSTEEPIPDRQTGQGSFWLDAETLEPLRLRTEVVSYLGDEEIERYVTETQFYEFNEIERVPVEPPAR